MCMVRPVPRSRARSAEAASSSSEARSWPTSVTQPSTSPPAGWASITAAWRASTSSAGAANGPCSMSQPQVPIVPLIPAAPMPAAARSGWATVPASTTVVTPLARFSTDDSSADSSSSSPVWAPWAGTDHSKMEAPGGSRSGMQLRISGSPVRCWWALTMPGVTTQPDASITAAPRWRAVSSAADPTSAITGPRTATAPPTSTSRRGFMVTTSPPAISRSARSGPDPADSGLSALAEILARSASVSGPLMSAPASFLSSLTLTHGA